MSAKQRTIEDVLSSNPRLTIDDQNYILDSLLIHEISDFDLDKKLTSYPKVYVLITAGFEYIKIGTALDIKKRMSNIQSGCPFGLSSWLAIPTPLARNIERGLHHAFSDYNLRGEWFHLPNNQLDLLMGFFNQANAQVREVKHALLQA